MKKALFAAALMTGLLAPVSAMAAVVLDFEGIAPFPNNSDVLIQDYYNGGTSSIGTTGTNYGVSFSDNALLICLNSADTSCSNTSRGGLAPQSSEGGLYFLSGESTTLNYAPGFTDGFSFNYAEPNTAGGSINVYDGLNGTGNLLGSISLSLTPSTCDGTYNAGYCPFVPVGVSFAGTAKSIVFGGVANFVVFDDITFGSATPGTAAPEPATWAMMVLGFGAVGFAMRRRQKVTTSVSYAV